MCRLWKKGDVAPIESAASSVNRQSGDGYSAICYRMEPAKRMLNGQRCEFNNVPQDPRDGNRNPPCLLCDQSHTVIDLEKVYRVALMVTPQTGGEVIDQAWEAISTIRAVLKQQGVPMSVTSQTVFLRRAEDASICRRLFRAYFDGRMPATNYVVQPPCGGQALAIEAWAVGGRHVEVRFLHPDVVSVAYDGLRWIHVAGISPSLVGATAYGQSKQAFDALAARLDMAGMSFQDVVRTWLYQGGITEPQQEIERYRELNRARSDFFSDMKSLGRMKMLPNGAVMYPASTGIGMDGRGLVISCLALQTERDDVRLQPLENPRQTSAYDYARCYSVKSPKFSRATAVVIGDYVTNWISGTASIVNSDSVHIGDVEKQTEQTIDNIQNLISTDNLQRHGLPGAGAQLTDLAKVRVYIKRVADYDKCRAICDRRFGAVPTIYARADVCRSNLLVEIEGVAFSRLQPQGSSGK